MVLHQQLLEAQEHYQGPAEVLQIAAILPHQTSRLGNKSLSEQNSSTQQDSKKLAENYLGPFDIITHPGTHSFTLWLPE
jgi:hypothetical protein